MSQIVIDENGVEHEFPDEATPAMIAEVLSVTPVKAHVRKKKGGGPIKAIADLAPIAGGTVGGIIGGGAGALAGGAPSIPGAMGGAAIGGAGGAAVKQLLYRAAGFEEVPESAKEAALGIVDEGLTQGLLEPVGIGIGAGVKGAGQLAMRAGLRAPAETARAAIAHGITASSAGMRKVIAKIFDQDLITKRHLALAEAQGARFNPVHVAANALAKIRKQVSQSRYAKEDAEEAVQLALKYINNQDPEITPLQLHMNKRSMSEAAKSLRKAMSRSEQTTAGQEVDALWSKAFEEAANEALDQSVKGYTASNAVTSELIKVKEAVRATRPERGVPLAGRLAQGVVPPLLGGAVGGAVGAFQEGNRLRGAAFGAGLGAGAAFVGSPSALSKIGLGLNNPHLEMILRQTPRMLEGVARPPERRPR